MADLTSNLHDLATMVDGLVTEGSPSPKGSSHIVKDLMLERDLLTLLDITKRNGGKNQSSASEIVLGMSPRASIGVQSEAMGCVCSEIQKMNLAQQQKLSFGREVVSSPAVVHSQSRAVEELRERFSDMKAHLGGMSGEDMVPLELIQSESTLVTDAVKILQSRWSDIVGI
ncbi:hypothetical protein CsSME_00054175 [Camellia sinensis var. sinensis]